MSTSNNIHRPFGVTGIVVPPVAFRADVLDSLLRALPDKTKRLIFSEWVRCTELPVFIDVLASEKHSLQPNMLGRLLTHLDVAPDDVVINLSLELFGDSRILAEPHPIRTEFGRACDLLGKKHMPRLVTLRVTTNDSVPIAQTFKKVVPSIVESLHELESLKNRHPLAAVGIALKDWRIGQQLCDVAEVGFIKLLSGPTVLRHPPEMLEWLADLSARQVPVITAGVFHGGFLAGGPTFDGRVVNPEAPTDQSLITWRKSFASLCHGHGVRPAHACIQFALGIPGVVAASLRTSHVDRVAEVIYAATTPIPSALWESMKEEGLLRPDYGVAPT